MEPVDPRINPIYTPAGTVPKVYGRGQPGVKELPTILTPRGYMITRWSPTDEERQRILEGEDIYVSIQNGGIVNPMFVTIGPIDWNTR